VDGGGGAIGAEARAGAGIPGRAMKCPEDDGVETSVSADDQGARGRGISGVFGGDRGIRC
jgi:hypothetical protein